MLEYYNVPANIALIIFFGILLMLTLRAIHWIIGRFLPDEIIIKIIGGNDDDGEEESKDKA